jgi:hypothetical protein
MHPIWRDADVVLLQDGLKSGEQLIVSDLPAPVQGMSVRVEPSKSETRNDQPVKKNTEKDKTS